MHYIHRRKGNHVAGNVPLMTGRSGAYNIDCYISNQNL